MTPAQFQLILITHAPDVLGTSAARRTTTIPYGLTATLPAGPIMAAAFTGDIDDVTASQQDHFATYNSTMDAVEVRATDGLYGDKPKGPIFIRPSAAAPQESSIALLWRT